MNLNQPSLVQFEMVRKQNNVVPPLGSNSFYNIGTGRINLLTLRSDPDDYRFNLFTDSGQVYTGPSNFTVSGDIVDSNNPYNNLTVIKNTMLSINNMLTISSGKMEVYGTAQLLKNSKLYLKNNAEVIFYPDSVFDVNDKIEIVIENGSSLKIYGEINIHLNSVYNLINIPGVVIDSAAVMNVDGLDKLGKRPFSLTDYYTELSNRVINVHTQGEKNFSEGRLGYTWTGGSPANGSQLIRMSTLYGECILGDFKLSVLGYPINDIANLQMISDLHIQKGTVLNITDKYNGNIYIRPELYLGIVISNNTTPGACVVDGTIIADGTSSLITLDRGATMHITSTGSVYLKNGATMRSTYNDGIPVLFIDGTLIIDDVSQIVTFNEDNIVFGENGKVVILNPDDGKYKLLWTTPIGIESTDLYRLFKTRIDHVEYHISNNTGIGIDKYYEFYSRDMTEWYGGRRIEQAIHDGILVWHDGGCIELYHDVIPWVNIDCTLLEASRIFKTFGSYDSDKLQDAVNRLKYAGCGDIVFRFIDGDSIKFVTLTLDTIKMTNVLNYPLTNTYVLNTTNDGQLFLKNRVGHTSFENIINSKARVFDIVDKSVEFPLP